MKVLVTFASRFEFAPWRRLRVFRCIAASTNCAIYRNRSGEGEVSAVITGAGADNARRTVGAVLKEAPDVCVVTGLAGGLKTEYRPGEILVARSVITQSGAKSIESDKNLRHFAVECGAKPVPRFISVEKIVNRAAEKNCLSVLADAVEMESHAVMSEMARRSVPCVALRSIGDPAEVDLPYNFQETLDSGGHVQVCSVLAQIARNPLALPGLIRFSMESYQASASLARFLETFIRDLVVRKEPFVTDSLAIAL